MIEITRVIVARLSRYNAAGDQLCWNCADGCPFVLLARYGLVQDIDRLEVCRDSKKEEGRAE